MAIGWLLFGMERRARSGTRPWCRRAEVTGQVTPGAKLVSYHVDIKRLMNRQVALAIADGTMAVDGETVYEVKGMKVATYISTEDE